MTIINGVNMQNFTHTEIPRSKAKFIDRVALRSVQAYRDILGCPFSISLNDGALIRFDGRKTSEHHVIIDPVTDKPIKLSRAIDGFPSCNIFEAWTMALSSKFFGGIGVYFDTNGSNGEPWPMLHLDLRGLPLIWYRDNGEYYYPHKSKTFFHDLQNLFMINRA